MSGTLGAPCDKTADRTGSVDNTGPSSGGTAASTTLGEHAFDARPTRRALPVAYGDLEFHTDRPPNTLGLITCLEGLGDRPAPQPGDHVVSGDRFGVGRTELLAHPEPELRKAHSPQLPCRALLVTPARQTLVVTSDALERLGPATRAWFTAAFPAPTPAQQGAWAAIAGGRHALVVAPTGSGKTLAAFLWALDQLTSTPPPADKLRRCRVVYVSPLKALAVDIERNLRSPLAGIRHAATRLGLPEPAVRVGVRSGDTPADERRRLATAPPDILITTPESLFLILTSQAREGLRGVQTVIVDEIHAVAGTKRGAHLAVCLERLDALLERPAQRIGLSATVRPASEVARFLGGQQPVDIVAPTGAKTVEVRVEVTVEDMAAIGEIGAPTPGGPGTAAEGASAASAEARTSIWPSIERRVLELVRGAKSTIVFANSRRLAERLCSRLNELAESDAAEAAEAARSPGAPTLPADLLPAARYPAALAGQAGTAEPPAPGSFHEVARPHHGSMSREQRSEVEEALKSGRLPCVVATSSLELGVDMGAVDFSGSAGPATRSERPASGSSCPNSGAIYCPARWSRSGWLPEPSNR